MNKDISINQEIAVTHHDVEQIRRRGYENEALIPKVEDKRNMNTINYFNLWMGNLHNIPNYAAAGGFLVLGIAPINVMVALIIGALIVGGVMAFNGVASSKYGIPFSMQLRSVYGATGAKLPGFLRGIIVAIAWFGLQTYTGSQALLIIISQIWPAFTEIGGSTLLLGLGIPSWITFLLFWLMNVAIGLSGGSFLNKFNTILTVLIYVMFISMAVWGVNVGGGFSNILKYAMTSSANQTSHIFSYLLIINAVLAFWSAPSLSVGDFSQNAKSTKDQMFGQFFGLIFGYVIFAFTSVTILIGSSIHYGVEQWDVLSVINYWDSLPLAVLASLVLLLITVQSNAIANVIPATFQLMALFPKHINYKMGVLIASLIGIVIMPWKLMENPDSIYTFLNSIGAVLGPVTGILLYHFYIVDKQVINLDELYYDLNTSNIKHKYSGINKNAYVATLTGLIISLSGMFIPSLSVLTSLSWLSGFIISVLVYSILTKFNHNTNSI